MPKHYDHAYCNCQAIFPDGTHEEARSFNITSITWSDYPDGPVLSTYQVDDLKVAQS